MSTRVCIVADTLDYPEGGGHAWVSLNWALGLRACGCEIIWLERVGARVKEETETRNIAKLRERLERYGLGDRLVIHSPPGRERTGALAECADLDAATDADLLLTFQYDLTDDIVKRFRRSALLDIDPGLLQVWLNAGQIRLASYDIHFTIGETVGKPNAKFPAGGKQWHYTPPCVSLEHWPVAPAADDAPFTTISHWYADEWINTDGELYANDKRAGFLPFFELPQMTNQPLELALCLGDDDYERQALRKLGWRVRESSDVAGTPWAYQQYIQQSRGEFSCVKPSCIRLQNAWISDRTICYLASGKPAIVQHTGPSEFLPNDRGLWRFEDLAGAARCLQSVQDDYARQSRFSRELAEEYFDASKVAARLLERAMN